MHAEAARSPNQPPVTKNEIELRLCLFCTCGARNETAQPRNTPGGERFFRAQRRNSAVMASHGRPTGMVEAAPSNGCFSQEGLMITRESASGARCRKPDIPARAWLPPVLYMQAIRSRAASREEGLVWSAALA